MPQFPNNLGRLIAPVAMLLGVIAVYLPPGVWTGDFELLGADFAMLHQHRIDFAQASLVQGSLPGWYPRELCGSPFWANVQNFPFIPTRLALLWLRPGLVFPASLMVSALLAAIFTFAFARRIGVASIGASVAGWTFACSGFFAARVTAGHLPLLEAYPALPLLLWLIERAADVPTGQRRFDLGLLWLGFATTCVSLAGHPQLWVYALCVAILYAFVRCRVRRSVWVAAAMLAGLGIASFALWPMSLLIGQSTRVLPLDRAMNDIAMPYGRLLAAFLPWRDGFPINSPYVESSPLKHLPHAAYFWDTVWYVGWLPWAAAAGLAARWLVNKRRPDRRAWFLIIISAAALLLALPWVQAIAPSAGGTILRSPARLVYLTIFGLSLAAGAGVSTAIVALRQNGHTLRSPAVWCFLLLVIAHGADLAWHDRFYIVRNHPKLPLPVEVERQVRSETGDGRIAVDLTLPLAINRKLDDVSFFDSIMLARSYRFIMAMKNAPAGYNNQFMPAFSFDSSILRACGGRLLLTSFERPGLPLLRSVEGFNIYRINDAAPRARFFGADRVTYGSSDDAERQLRVRQLHPQERLLVEAEVPPPAADVPASPVPPAAYRRLSSDQLQIDVDAPAAGFVQILEAFDPGWRATVNGQPATIVPANLMFMAVAVGPGTNMVELNYTTPGRETGMLLSAVGVLGLAAIGLLASRFGGEAVVD